MAKSHIHIIYAIYPMYSPHFYTVYIYIYNVERVLVQNIPEILDAKQQSINLVNLYTPHPLLNIFLLYSSHCIFGVCRNEHTSFLVTMQEINIVI